MMVSKSSQQKRRLAIIEHPENAYIVKSQPVFLTCKASFAEKIRFKCNGDWVNEKVQEIRTDDPSYLETRIQIDRQEVEEYFGKDGFICECYAHSNSDSQDIIKSDSVKVEIANIRKHFEREPVSERKILGSIVHLPCLPPEGEPKPEVFWLKNDKELEPRSDKNVIIAHDGSLIIAIGRLMDSGNYTCGARNLAGQRFSQTVTITIFVDGKWSDWSPWSNINCVVNCETGLPLSWQARHRGCSKPAPANGGNFCQGESEQIRPCPTTSCSTTKEPMSDWSSWSKCNEECRQYRYRSCSAGKPCEDGFSKSHRTCPFADCLNLRTITTPNETENIFGLKTVMIAGLGAAIFFFLLIAMVLISILLRRKNRCQKAHKNQWSNGTTSRNEVNSDLLYDYLDSLTSNNSHQALLTDLPKSCAVYHCDSPEYQEYEILDSPSVQYHSYHTVPLVSVSMTVGFEGGQMDLPNTGIRLTIPYGAVDRNELIEVSISVTDDSPPGVTVLSPTVTCRPSTVTFKKPVVITVPHCAAEIDQWQFCLYEKQNDSWTVSTVIGNETLNTQCYCQVDMDCVHIITENLSQFSFTGKNLHENEKVLKRFRFLSFSNEFCSRLYLVADIPANVSFVTSNEKKSGRFAVHHQIVFFDCNETIYVSYQTSEQHSDSEKDSTWPLSNCHEIPCGHLWGSLSFGCAINLLPNVSKRAIIRVKVGQKCFVMDPHSIQIEKNEKIFEPQRSCITLPQDTMKQLAALLNPPTKSGNDWRMLAKILKLDQYLPYFASRTSPTELMLHLWEARTKSFDDLKDLWKILYTMDRLDACYVLNVVLES